MYEVIDITQDLAENWLARVSVLGSTALLRFLVEPSPEMIQEAAARYEIMLRAAISQDFPVEEQADGAPNSE